MKNYKLTAGIQLPLTKYIPGYGMATITAATTDAQAEAIIATGHGHMFEAAIDRDDMLMSNEADSESKDGTLASPTEPTAELAHQMTKISKPQKRHGKAK